MTNLRGLLWRSVRQPYRTRAPLRVLSEGESHPHLTWLSWRSFTSAPLETAEHTGFVVVVANLVQCHVSEAAVHSIKPGPVLTLTSI